MNEAVIAQEGTPRQLYEEPDSLFVADFIGDANLAKAELVQLDGKEAEVNIGGFTMRLPHRGLASGAVNVAIRPQAILLQSSGEQTGIPGTIQKAIYLGNHIEYTIDSPVGELFMIGHQVDQLQPSGSKVTISFLRRGVSLVRAD